MNNHFSNQDPLTHVMQKRMEGIVSLSESHGTEMPGHFSAGADGAKEMGMVLLLFSIFLPSLTVLFSVGIAFFAWKTGRSGWLGWTRLERMHRVIEQEKYEIEHHRPQEREELVALYSAKGFEGQLLDNVVDVLMADQDRLLKVMLEEEMGLTLQAYEHPLQQAFGAAIGTLFALGWSLLLYFLLPPFGMLIAASSLLISAATLSAILEKNRIIAAIIWNLSIGALSLGLAYFVFQIFM